MGRSGDDLKLEARVLMSLYKLATYRAFYKNDPTVDLADGTPHHVTNEVKSVLLLELGNIYRKMYDFETAIEVLQLSDLEWTFHVDKQREI